MVETLKVPFLAFLSPSILLLYKWSYFFCTVWNIFYLLVTTKIYGFRSPSWMLTTILHFPLNISTHEVLQALQVQHLKLWSLFSLLTLLLLFRIPILLKSTIIHPTEEPRNMAVNIDVSLSLMLPPLSHPATKSCDFYFKSYKLSSLWQELMQWCSFLKAVLSYSLHSDW